jgi:hypothetical protein
MAVKRALVVRLSAGTHPPRGLGVAFATEPSVWQIRQGMGTMGRFRVKTIQPGE